jgi:dTDP-4-amino-4,6-dideoxygalactose transaminase
VKYIHDIVGVNSRLDSMQAAVLKVKLPYLDKYAKARNKVAKAYDKAFKDIEGLQTPKRQRNASHVFHQYTLRVKGGKREALQKHLESKGIPSMIYYPIPLYKQKAFAKYWNGKLLPITEMLCDEVVSLPIHTEMDSKTMEYIIENVVAFFKQ